MQQSPPPLLELLQQAEVVVAEAAATLVRMQDAPLRTERKDLLDVVTEADLAAEEIVVAGLTRLTPQTAILAEERGAIGGANGERWIIDPLDGTVNFAAGLPWFSVTVAYESEGEILLGLVNAPKAGIQARYASGHLATIDGQAARVKQTRSLSDAVLSVCLTSHFSPDEVRRTSAIVERLASVARGVRVVVSGGLELSLVASGRLRRIHLDQGRCGVACGGNAPGPRRRWPGDHGCRSRLQHRRPRKSRDQRLHPRRLLVQLRDVLR